MIKQLSRLSLVLLVSAACACNEQSNKQLPATTTKFDEAIETEAINKVIAAETDCFFKGDYACWSTYWSHKSYILQAWNNDDGTADVAIGWEKISARAKDWIEKYYKNGKNIIHPEVRRDTPFVKFFSDSSAYLTWKQYNADKEKSLFRTSQEIRLMEKQADGWKIAHVSAFWDTEAKIPYDSLAHKIN